MISVGHVWQSVQQYYRIMKMFLNMFNQLPQNCSRQMFVSKSIWHVLYTIICDYIQLALIALVVFMRLSCKLDFASQSFKHLDEEAAKVLNTFFIQYSQVSTCTALLISPCLLLTNWINICITEVEVFKMWSSIKPIKAPGPDNIHSDFQPITITLK